MKFKIFILLIVATLLLFLFFRLLPILFDRGLNRVRLTPPYNIPAEVLELHNRLFVVDLHCDFLLWDRDLLKKGVYGQTDLPRMLMGNLAFQVFGVVTQFPGFQNRSRTKKGWDSITPLVICQGWPPKTWSGFLQRALYQAKRLQDFARDSAGKLRLVGSAAELKELITKRNAGKKVIGAFLSLEGVQALEGKIENLDLLYKAGYRMLGLSHFFDTDAGGSAHSEEKGGLSPYGKTLVQRIQSGKMIIDLAHSSPAVFEDVFKLSIAPLVVSHTGVRGTCDNERNISDKQIHGIAATGGIIGIGFFKKAVGDIKIEDTARAIRYVANLAGVAHVAIGSDFDGAVITPMDISGLALLTQALIKEKFSEEEIEMIMGGNFIRVVEQCLE
ncbi:dipeptidase [Candidatus Riflebacteria bacterium]